MLDSASPGPPPGRSSLKQRVFHASAWSLAGYGASMAIRFGSNLVMTRLLVPEMFGVMAIATIIMVGLAMFSDIGVRQSIVQSRRGNDPAFLNTAWTLQILRGFALWLIALAIAIGLYLADRTGMIPNSSVYADPSLPWVIAVLSFGTVISGFATTKAHEASRNLLLGRVTQIELIAQVAGLCVMLAWVSQDRSVWALVAGGLTAQSVSVIAAHVWLPGTANQWHWDKSSITELLHFGKWIFASSILGFFANSGDRLLLGAMVDAATLGVYVIAFLIFSAIEQVLNKIVGEISFPAFSILAREQRADLKGNCYRFHAVIAGIAYVGAGTLLIAGQTVIDALYDSRYSQAGWILQLLAVALITIPARLSVVCLMALGLPHYQSYIIVARIVTLCLATPFAFYFFGLRGAVIAIVISYFSSLLLTVLYAKRHAIVDFRKELLMLPIILVGFILGATLNVIAGR